MTTENTDWTGRVAVVTGAGGGMGRSVVQQMVARGVKVAGFDRTDYLEETRASLGDIPDGQFLGLEVDVSDLAAITSAFEKVDRELGPTTLLANFAGVNCKPQSIVDCDEEDWNRVLGINLGGTFWCCREAMKRMIPLRRGSIVNTSSISSLRAKKELLTHPYTISKAAIVGLTVSLAAEAAAHGIRVNAVSPGLHRSIMSTKTMAGSAEETQHFFDKALNSTPLKRIAEASEMAGPVMFLLGEDSAYMTGQILTSDGGRTIWYD